MAGSVNKVILVGNLGADPEVKSFQNGGKVCNLRIATSESWKDRMTGERKERTEWHSVAIFSEGLAGVAERTAERVADTGEAADLEPMPAYERRWVHMALANNTDVRTESSGEGSDRFIVIYPGGDGGAESTAQGRRRPRGRGGRRSRR